MIRPTCTLPGCGRPHHGHGFCHPHHARWQRHGNPLSGIPIGSARTNGESSRSVRRRLRAVRGAAEGHGCAGCGGAAVVWSYDGTDRDARTDPADGHRYSLDLVRYRPLCRGCQRRAAASGSGRRAAVVDLERAARLYRAGATARGIASVLRTSPAAVLAALRAHGVPIRPPARQRRHQPATEQPQHPDNPPSRAARDPHTPASATTTETRSPNTSEEQQRKINNQDQRRHQPPEQKTVRTNASRSDGGFREP